MSANIMAVEDHKTGSFYINVHLSGVGYEKFSSMLEVNEFLNHWKEVFGKTINVTLKQLVIMQRKEMLYESAYCL